MNNLERIDRALSSRATLQTSYDLARLAIDRNVAGDFVECGVFAGSQCAAMALAIMEHHGWPNLDRYESNKRHGNVTRRVHAFDSFEGIPEAGPHDHDFKKGGHVAGASACSLEDVQANMIEWGIDPELLIYHPGPFAKTLPLGVLYQIAVLRLDADLYESTRVALRCLYPQVSPGGWVIVDDFGLDGARKAVDEYMDGEYPPVYWQRT